MSVRRASALRLFPQFIWLATGGKSQLGSKLNVLRGRKVIAYPDVDTYTLDMSDSPPLGIDVSDLLERTATKDDQKRKIDIDDRIIAERRAVVKEISIPA